ncbi:hypothetical protein BDZ45DRAFT_32028 [Acephala macrosclerotiorum]|nr:hypothetical protein BDZ45DRAFT_32028 [Acephala macrosclerotiorum]
MLSRLAGWWLACFSSVPFMALRYCDITTPDTHNIGENRGMDDERQKIEYPKLCFYTSFSHARDTFSIAEEGRSGCLVLGFVSFAILSLPSGEPEGAWGYNCMDFQLNFSEIKWTCLDGWMNGRE